MGVKALVGATVLDGAGGEPVSDGFVLVDGGVVRSVGRGPVPLDGVEVVDCARTWIIPGMMDANVHLSSTITPDLALEFEGRYDETILEAAQQTLRAGITTVFDTWGPTAALTSVRDRITRGDAIGSRMFVAGNIIGFDGPLSPDFTSVADVFGTDTISRINAHWERGVGGELAWLTPDEIRARVRIYVETSGVDFLKYASSGHAQMQLILFSAEAQRAIVEEGHRAGMTVQAHSTSVESLRLQIEAGADLLQHGNVTGLAPMPESFLELIAERQIPVAALYYTRAHLDWSTIHRPPFWNLILNEHLAHNNRRLIEVGANILLTTDGFAYGPRHRGHPRGETLVGAPDVPVQLGESHVAWVKAVLELGMSPMDALLAATSRPARAYGHPELGALQPGKVADLVVLDADPLADPENYRAVRAVMKAGVVVDRDELPIERILTERVA